MPGDLDEGRRSRNRLSEEELEAVARRAADLVWESFERQVGKTAIRLILYVLGAVCLVALAWLNVDTKIKP